MKIFIHYVTRAEGYIGNDISRLSKIIPYIAFASFLYLPLYRNLCLHVEFSLVKPQILEVQKRIDTL